MDIQKTADQLKQQLEAELAAMEEQEPDELSELELKSVAGGTGTGCATLPCCDTVP